MEKKSSRKNFTSKSYNKKIKLDFRDDFHDDFRDDFSSIELGPRFFFPMTCAAFETGFRWKSLHLLSRFREIGEMFHRHCRRQCLKVMLFLSLSIIKIFVLWNCPLPGVKHSLTLDIILVEQAIISEKMDPRGSEHIWTI